MLKKNILATNTIYVSIAHDKKYIEKYFKNLQKIFLEIKEFENGKNVDLYLETSVAQNSFERMN